MVFYSLLGGATYTYDAEICTILLLLRCAFVFAEVKLFSMDYSQVSLVKEDLAIMCVRCCKLKWSLYGC